MDTFDFQGDRPSAYQLDVLRGLVSDERQQAMKGPRGCGKTALGAWVVHWFADVWDTIADWIAVTQASNWNQLKLYLWPAIHLWARRKKWNEIPIPRWTSNQLMNLSLKLNTGSVVSLSPARYQEAEGAHAARVLYIYDEAKLIEHEVFTSARGAMSTGVGYQLALSTPGEESGAFYDLCRGARPYTGWHVRNVSVQEAIAEGRIERAWADKMLEDLGEDHPMYRQYVLAQFSSMEGANLILLSHVEMAQDRDGAEDAPLTALAVDLGEGVGRDATVYALVYGGTRVEVEKTLHADLAQAEDRVAQIVGLNKRVPIIIDAIGVGAAVVKHLERRGYSVIPFVSSWGTTMKDEAGIFGYANWRAAGWYLLKALLDPKNPWSAEVALPTSENLRADITAVKAMAMTPRQQYRVEPKERIKKQLGRSPDEGDAVMMALTGQALWAAKMDETPVTQWEYRPARV